ncbi:hypothetical protein Bca4012_026989 [Brassica carinata]
MQALFEKLEHGVYSLWRMKESAATKFKSFQIPVDWMLETGITSQIKLASVKLAMKYMKRVSAELEAIGGGGPEEEELIVQGVRFAFRVHQIIVVYVSTTSAFSIVIMTTSYSGLPFSPLSFPPILSLPTTVVSSTSESFIYK